MTPPAAALSGRPITADPLFPNRVYRRVRHKLHNASGRSGDDGEKVPDTFSGVVDLDQSASKGHRYTASQHAGMSPLDIPRGRP